HHHYDVHLDILDWQPCAADPHTRREIGGGVKAIGQHAIPRDALGGGVALLHGSCTELQQLGEQGIELLLGVRDDLDAGEAGLVLVLADAHLVDLEVRPGILDRAPDARQDERIDDVAFELDLRAGHSNLSSTFAYRDVALPPADLWRPDNPPLLDRRVSPAPA